MRKIINLRDEKFSREFSVEESERIEMILRGCCRVFI